MGVAKRIAAEPRRYRQEALLLNLVSTKETPMSTTVKKTNARRKVAGKKKAAKKPAKKKTAKKPATKQGSKDLTKAQHRTLDLLRRTKKGAGLTRTQLVERSGITKGWSRVLGAATKDTDPNTLLGKKYVEAHKEEGESYKYSITERGKKALAAADKANK